MSAKPMRKVQIGQEATGSHGVAVNPEIALWANVDLKADATKRVSTTDIACLAPRRSRLTTIKASGPLNVPEGNYQQLPYVASMALGDVEATGSDVACIWNFPFPCATKPTFCTYTMEYLDDAEDGQWITHATDVFATDLTIRGVEEDNWTINASLTGATTTFPIASVDPLVPVDPTIDDILMATTGLWMDDSYADIGTTPVLEAAFDFTWKLSGLQHSKWFMGSYYPSGRGHGKWAISLEIEAEVENAVMLAERAKQLSDETLTAIRIQSSEVVFPGVTWIARLDGNYMLDDITAIKDRDENNIVTLHYRGEMDIDGNTGALYIVNDLCDLAEPGYWYAP